MSLTNADLLAIEQLLDKKINPIENKVDGLENRFNKLEDRFDKLEDRFDKLEDRFDKLEDRFDKLEDRFDKLEGDVSLIKLQLEQDIVPRLTNIESCYVSTYERYVKTTERVEKYIEKQDLLTAIVLEHDRKFKQLNM